MLSQNKLNVFFFVLIYFNITRDRVLQFWWWMLCYRGDFRCLLLTKISSYIRDKGVPGYGKLSQAHIHVGHRHWWLWLRTGRHIIVSCSTLVHCKGKQSRTSKGRASDSHLGSHWSHNKLVKYNYTILFKCKFMFKFKIISAANSPMSCPCLSALICKMCTNISL